MGIWCVGIVLRLYLGAEVRKGGESGDGRAEVRMIADVFVLCFGT